MSKLGSFKNSLLMSAVALSVLSSSANAVSGEVVRGYWQENSFPSYSLYSETLKNLEKLNDAQWEKFKELAKSFMTPDMNGENRATVITALANVAPEKWEHFVKISQSLMSENMHGWHRALVIQALGKVAPEIFSHEKFLATVQSFITPDMYGWHRADVVKALGKVAPEK